jgi:hypothetical protein
VAKGYQKGNREKRKPKADKPKPVAQTSPFGRGPGTGGSGKRTARKGR